MIIGLLLLASVAQTDSLDEPGPPQENLLRSFEQIGSVLCSAPDRDAVLRTVELRYRKRMRAVHDAVAREYGEQAANRSYITVGSCLRYRWEVDLQRGVDRAIDSFERELVGWESRYNIRGHRTI